MTELTVIATGEVVEAMTKVEAERITAQIARKRDPEAGAGAGVERFLRPVLADCLAHGIRIVSNFGAANPAAAAFWAGVWLTALNYLVKITPTNIDDSLLDAIAKAISNGLERTRGKK